MHRDGGCWFWLVLSARVRPRHDAGVHGRLCLSRARRPGRRLRGAPAAGRQALPRRRVAHDSLGGGVTIAQVGGEKAFTITIKGIDRHACVKMVTSEWGKNVWIKACKELSGEICDGDGSEKMVTIENAVSECSDPRENNITWKVK